MKKILIINFDKKNYGGASNNLNLISNLLKINKFDVDNMIIDNNLKKNSSTFFKNFFYKSYYLFNILEKLKFYVDYLKSRIFFKIEKKNYSYILFKNYRAIHLAKKISNNQTKLIFLCSGFMVSDFTSHKNLNILSKKVIYRSVYENYVFKNSNKIFVNSNISKKVVNKNYKCEKNVDIIWTSSFSYTNQVDFSVNRKKYDLIFSCSNFEREEKNANFFLNLLNILSENLKILIVGNNQKQIFRSKNIIQKNYLTKKKLDTLLKQTKIALIPSKFDSSPNIFFESLNNNCIPLVSKNCGIPKGFKNFQINSFDIKKWSLKIIKILDNYEHEFNKNKLYKIKINELKKNNEIFFISKFQSGNTK